MTDDGGGSVFYLSDYKSSNPQRGVGWLPKLALNVNKCEVMRAYKLHPKGWVEVISFTVPRKSTLFQDDIFPPTKQAVAVMTADEWVGGKTVKPNYVSMKDFFVEEKRVQGGGGGLGGAPKSGGGLKKGGLGGSKPAAAAKPAPAAAKPASSSGGDSGRVAELEGIVAQKDAEIKELKRHLATLEIKLRELESQ